MAMIFSFSQEEFENLFRLKFTFSLFDLCFLSSVYFVKRKANSFIVQLKCKGHEKLDRLLVSRAKFNFYSYDELGYYNRLLYFRKIFWTAVGTLLHNEFKFLSVSCTLNVEVTSFPTTAKVLGSNLTRVCLFLKRKFSVSNKIVGLIFVCLSCRLDAASKSCLFLL